MWRRNAPNALQISETDGGEEWNHPDQTYMPTTIVGASGSSPLVHYPTVNIQDGPFPSSASTSSNRHQWPVFNAGSSHNGIQAPGPSRDTLLHIHKPADRNSRLVPNNNLIRQNAPRADGEGLHNQTVGRVSQKRKNHPCGPQISEMSSVAVGPTSSSRRYYDVGSSSNLHLPAGPPSQQKQNTSSSYPTAWKYPNSSLAIGSESTTRNVRSRGNFQNFPFSSQSSDQTNSTGFSIRSSNTPTMESNSLISRASHGTSLFGQNTLGPNNGTLNRNTVPRISSSNANQSFGGVQSGFSQRAFPTSGSSSSSNQAMQQLMARSEGTPNNAETNSERYQQFFSAIRLITGDREVRIGMPSHRILQLNIYNKYSLFYLQMFSLAKCRNYFQGRLVLNRSALYGPNNPFDQHRDMRLDVDNMSYEELLLLGERIGSVNTGLSNDLISKCLTESILCSSDRYEDDGRCVICLEEYKDMDDLGILKCGHDFHVGCVKKWLSMKNLCPICKKTANKEK
ncbi:E3 ubiquitin-protein ligase MBR2 [Striga hermonthica]|uniref:RING-type E3 ubiquitin transferase n=1 Tax=Striga hermonthica TaxID=68872 RepID=A0A9N7RH73_STRHE|nr:E3 ubiquitin-protein ligase MBR2 [Striga hermonthica]